LLPKRFRTLKNPIFKSSRIAAVGIADHPSNAILMSKRTGKLEKMPGPKRSDPDVSPHKAAIRVKRLGIINRFTIHIRNDILLRIKGIT
jgi:hypothetical protein